MFIFIAGLKEKVFLRNILILLSSFFILGAALNDGFSGWFFGIPFIILLYCILPLQKKWSLVICLTASLLVILVSDAKWKSSYIFPIIGQEVKITKDIHVVTYPDEDMPAYDQFYRLPQKENDYTDPLAPAITRDTVNSGTVFTVREIIAVHPEFTLNHKFVLSNNEQEIYVNDSGLFSDGNGDIEVPFCDEVEWQLCNSVFESGGIDPMAPTFRLLASLMYYPALPLLLASLFKAH